MIEEADELPAAMAILVRANHLAIEDIERGEKSRSAVALINVCLTLPQAGPQRRYRGSPIQCLNLAFLIDTQHQCVFGRVQVQTNYIPDFFSEAAIIRRFEALNPVRLNTVPLPGDRQSPGNSELVCQRAEPGMP